MDLSAVILAKNEQGNIGPIVTELLTLFPKLGVVGEVIVIDGGSSDRTILEAENAGARCIPQKRLGYGAALCEGLLVATGSYIATLDADGSHPPELLQRLWEVRERAEVAIASRFVVGGSSQAPMFRKVLSRMLNFAFKKAWKLPVQDFSSGYRLYRRRILTPDHYVSEDFNILPEILVRACAAGYRVQEIALQYRPRNFGASHVQLLRFGMSYFATIYRMWVLRNSVDSADYDARAYDSWIIPQRYWQRRRFSIIRKFAGSKDRMLDIGCGSSRIIQSLPQAVAFDYAFRKLRYLSRSNPMRVHGSTFALPFGDASFDVVVHSEVIEHIPFDLQIFRELNRILRSGGILVLGTPDYGRIWWPITEWLYGKLLPNAYADEHITHYTKQMLFDLLAQHGFRILDFEYILGGELIIKSTKVEDSRQLSATAFS